MDSPPTSWSDDRPGHGFQVPPKGYALSGKIMLIAIIVLFVVVVVMILLHIYARWYLLRGRRRHSHHIRRRNGRRTHLVFYVDSSNPASIFSFPQQGLDPLILKSLPTFTFSPNSKSASSEDENVLECAVCLSEFEDGETVRQLPKCNHCFHVDCIDMWFHSHSTCPLCRAPVDADFMSPVKIDDNQQPDTVVDLTESTNLELQSRSCLDTDLRPGSSNSSSFGGRRKGIDLVGVRVPIEVPARSASFSFTNSDELTSSPGFKSPTSRLLSLKRMLTWEKKPVQSPGSASCSGIGTSGSELVELEEGRVETRPQTPR